MEKLWMTYINALRPAGNRHWGAGPDSDHTRMAAELAAMSQDETAREVRDDSTRGAARRVRHTKRDLVSSATTAPAYHAPYDNRMSDRFKPVLSTR
ncbi:hypothetical protein IGS73_16520 [Janibacter indicus]|uniref:Uncharacterized protein n=1 Tax=Janibacter indicus TaxID=857417 RepID=A0A7L9IZU6_9MICO|nr:hypothetical protein [Janibacter indicus]QOK22639.1 hypothetical protein IGS73_16520 [Janibacter indicus]